MHAVHCIGEWCTTFCR